jgi:hypothetical protein
MRQAGINVIKLYAGDPDRNAGAPEDRKREKGSE